MREVDPVDPSIDVAPSRTASRYGQASYSVRTSLHFQPKPIVLAVRPGASGPSSAARASEKSPLEMHFR